MAAESLPLPDPPRQLYSELHVVGLLRSYRLAMALARQPPASLRLWRPLRWIHLHVRPRWACCYFTTRYVRGRVDALERALAGRIAVGEADRDDEREAEAIARFKTFGPWGARLLRRGSPLHAEAARLETVSQEDAAVGSASADFRREMPIDLLVKTLPGLVVAF